MNTKPEPRPMSELIEEYEDELLDAEREKQQKEQLTFDED